MREIKFRAWDKKAKTMLGEWTTDNLTAENDGWIENPSSLIWIQYTGLKDKNGKEIYEGDIVRVNSKMLNGDDFITIEKVVFFEELAGFGVMGYIGTPIKDFDEIEVIGNIYENPELLKD